MNTICRGTTPRVECAFREDLTGYDLYFSIGSDYRHAWFTVPSERMTVEAGSEGSTVVFTLEQRETLLCNVGKAIAQFRIIDEDGDARASNILELQIIDIVKDGVIRYA